VIKITGLCKDFDGHVVIDNLSLSVPKNKMTVIIGRSGEGKSVLLKLLIGLLKPTAGSVLIDDQEVTKLSDHQLEAIFKKCGYVFQFAALLDSLTIFENVGITLLEHGIHRDQVLPIVIQKLSLVNLTEDILFKYPGELSGGMRKRVGLARTLLMNPQIILYDEPTTGLDPITTRVVHELMSDMQKKLNITSVVISHDVDIFRYADFVALLYKGKIEYFGEAQDIWNSDNPYIYQFIRGLASGPIQTDLAHSTLTEQGS
jgi:phospholipid/cholesterol/gamma-HCH transport system ATP-binding protein